jgi:drug/metabolite transporter (DMT)-like permease
MLWAVLAVFAALIWAIVNIVDKFIVTKWFRNPLIPVLFFGLFGFFATLTIFFVLGFSYLSPINIILALLAGVFHTVTYLFYFMALKLEEVSRVVPLFYLSPIFVLILATLFLGEHLTLINYMGFFFLVIGAIIISTKSLSIKLEKAFWYMILADICLALSAVLTKYLLNMTDYWTVFAYGGIGNLFILVPLAYFVAPDLMSALKKHGAKAVVTTSLNEMLNLVAVLASIIATSIGFVTLVNALASVQPFFLLVFTVVLSLFFPKILKEEISKSTVLIKSAAIVIMFIGAYLVI